MDRKTVSGPVRNKERTKSKILKAVGTILKKEGYTALKINKIADVAGVDKKLIYNYFGSTKGLIDTYLKREDYWMDVDTRRADNPITDISKDVAFEMLKNQYEFFLNSTEKQKIVLWELSEKNKVLLEMIAKREKFGDSMFKLTDKYFKGTTVNFRAVSAILITAIYYIILHEKTNGYTICGMDILSAKGKKELLKTVSDILDWSYTEAETQKAAKQSG